jgi:hypothetical protein
MRNTEKVRRSTAPNLLVQYPLAELTLQFAVDPSKSRRSIPARADGKSQRLFPTDSHGLLPQVLGSQYNTSPHRSAAWACRLYFIVYYSLMAACTGFRTIFSSRCRSPVLAWSAAPRRNFLRLVLLRADESWSHQNAGGFPIYFLFVVVRCLSSVVLGLCPDLAPECIAGSFCPLFMQFQRHGV